MSGFLVGSTAPAMIKAPPAPCCHVNFSFRKQVVGTLENSTFNLSTDAIRDLGLGDLLRVHLADLRFVLDRNGTLQSSFAVQMVINMNTASLRAQGLSWGTPKAIRSSEAERKPSNDDCTPAA